MAELPLVSVIIPVFNAQDYLEASIGSILTQSYQNLEIIILDDASTDNSLAIINTVVNNDPRVQLVCNPTNLYIARNRNKGIGLAHGKYIVWQDADDVSDNQRIEKLVHLMEKNNKIGIAGSSLQVFDASGDKEVRRYSLDDASLRANIFKFSPVAQPSAIIRRECFDKLGLYDESTPPVEDLDMSFRIGTAYEFANLDESLIKYRLSSTNQTHKNMKKMIRVTLATRKKYSTGYGYKMRLSDRLAYSITWATLYLNPSFTYKLFNIARKVVRILHI